MAFLIKYEDITNVFLFSENQVSGWNKELTDLKDRMTAFSGLTSFDGAGAQNIRNYLQDVHGTILVSFQEILNEFSARFLLYRDGYYQKIDADSHAVLTEDTFNQLLSFYPNSQTSFEEVHANFIGTINAIRDIFGPGVPDVSGVRQGYDTVKSTVTTLRDTTGSYETGHAGSDLTNLDDLLASLRTFISYYRDFTYTSAAPSYAAGSAGFCPGAADLEFALNQAYNGRVELSDELTSAVANETVRMDSLKKELADQRAKDGAFQWVLGAGAVIVGVAAIVLTAGMATPLVVAAAVAGSCSIAYGVSNIVEADQNIAYGLAGDPYTTAVNPIRDTVFMGNQSAYDTWGAISVGAASLFIPIGSGLNAAKTAGVLGIKGVTRVVGVEIGKYAVSAGAGMAGGYAGTYYGTEYFGPEAGRWIGLGTGLVTGIGVGYGVNGLAKTLNLNGLQPSAAAKTTISVTEGAGETGKSFEDVIIRDGSQLENGKIKPNVTYQSGEYDYIYKTNEDGLITNASTDSLQIKNHSGRLNHNPNTYGKVEGDQAGHLFGDRFGGSPELDNLVSQAKRVNLSEFKILENHWASALKNGQQVAVDITINYANGGIRPVSFDVSYTLDGIPFFSSISN